MRRSERSSSGSSSTSSTSPGSSESVPPALRIGESHTGGCHGSPIGPGIETLERARSPAYTPPAPPFRSGGITLQRKANVLVVDDEELYRRALERILQRVGHAVVSARDASEALAIVAAQPIDLVLADIRMPGINGLELVRQIHEFAPDLPCIVITGYGGAEQSVEALRAGAFWYLEKPFDQGHLDVVRRLVEQAIEMGRLRVENRILQRELRSKYGFENIVGNSPILRSVLDVVAKVADSDSTVLITGESGTGKELIARAIHYNSRRAERMFVTVNCGAIPEELLESELFGHVRGAFTNAVSHREGRFSLANEGTIFLDEIGDMSTNLQVKLLRVLQDRTFEPVGSSKTVSVNVRVIAATNQDLEEAIRERRFREDLFYRLNVIPIEAPPLRHAARGHRAAHPALPRAREPRPGPPGPGHLERGARPAVRLRLARQRARAREPDRAPRDPGRRARDHAPRTCRPTCAGSTRPALSALRVPATGLSFRDVVEEVEEQLIREALEHTHGNKNRAAQLLGLNRTTLLEKMKRRAGEPGPPPPLAPLAPGD